MEPNSFSPFCGQSLWLTCKPFYYSFHALCFQWLQRVLQATLNLGKVVNLITLYF
uniref:Uncharacterized protein n=1 Tax=Arundo donax TaxID=35708 RepID=A0A0A9DCK8_ARUDO